MAGSLLLLGTVAVETSGLINVLPHVRIEKSTHSPRSAIGRYVKTSELRGIHTEPAIVVPNLARVVLVYGPCSGCQSQGPWELAQLNVREPVSVVLYGENKDVSPENWRLPDSISVWIDESRECFPQAIYDNAPIGVVLNGQKIIDVVPLEIAVESVTR